MWKIGTKLDGDKDWIFTDVRYATAGEAAISARKLQWACSAIKDWKIVEDEPINAAPAPAAPAP